MNFKFDDSIKKIKKGIKKTKVSYNTLFNPLFMKSFTNSNNFEEFILKSGLVNSDKEVSEEAFKAIPEKDLDKYICKNTKFSSWKAMRTKAEIAYYKDQFTSKGMQSFEE
jgi:5'-3' exonuclease